MPTKPTTRSGSNPFTRRREPLHFMLWLGIGGSVLVFTVLLSLYIIRQTSADWQTMPLPGVFWLSTLVIVLSSLSIHEASDAFHKERFQIYRICMGTTLFLGLAFTTLQFFGWLQLIEQKIFIDESPAASFIYLLSGLHLLHIVVGLVFLTLLFRDAIRNRTYVDSFIYSVNPPNQLRLKLMTIYWHFVDVLWIILFFFLLYHYTA
jgi:cytochrome c oxidase subunit III